MHTKRESNISVATAIEESVADKELTRLIADPQRQAHASLRGYLYQIWVSVLTWLDLGDDEILYLEGAEDIDRISKKNSETTQVKDQSANVTLRSADVIAAIGNYWELRSRDPSRKIKFRFLTTAESGFEQGSPFGKGVKGLDCWETARRSQDAATLLINFLKTVDSFPFTLKERLQTANVEEITKELIDPIFWEVGAGDAECMEAEIERKLVLLGEKFGILPDNSKKAVDALLKSALKIASAEDDRPLDRVQLLELFQEVTTIRVPCTGMQVANFAQQIADSFMPSSGAVDSMHLSIRSRVQWKIPNLPDFFVPRTKLVSDCLSILRRTGFIVLSGSMGMGKTTLAKLLAKEGGDWIWVNFSAVHQEGVACVLRSLGEVFDADPNICNVLLDDIDLNPEACREYEAALGGLMKTLHGRKGSVVVTSQREPSQRLQSALSLKDENLLRVPALTEDEIIALLGDFGFSGGKRTELQYAKIIYLQTSGHPQLVLATIGDLSNAGWPSLNVETLLNTPEGVLEAKRETLQILVNKLSPSQRTVIYRLGTVGLFRRDQAVMIGQTAGVQEPGNVFDSLVGPWIETIAEDYYRVSPLIAHVAKEALGQKEVDAIHYELAEAILAAGKLSQYEANTIFMHAFIGKNARVLLISAYGILTSDEKVRVALSNELSWFLAFVPLPGHLLFPEDVRINATLRMLQFRIAVDVDPSKAEKIAARWDEELVECEPRELFLLQRSMYVLQLLLNFHAPIRPARLVACFKELEELQLVIPKLAENMKSMELPQATDFPEFDISDPAKFFFGITLSRCSSSEFLQELFVALDDLPAELKGRILSTFSESAWSATMLIDRVWLAESKKECPDWASCLAALNDIKMRGTKLSIPNLVYAVARGSAIIQDEYLENPDEAIAEIDAAEKSLGVSPVTQDERATILYNHKHYKEALLIWQKRLEDAEQSKTSYDPTIWTCRKAGISAAKIGDWSLAAAMFMTGFEKGRETDLPWATVGFLGDAAFAHWMAGEYPKMVNALLLCLQLLEKLPDSREDFTTFSVEKMVGCVLLWISGELKGVPKNERSEPYAGLCSDPEPNEKLRELPRTVMDYLWLLLVEIEHELSLDETAYGVAYSRLDNSTYAVVQLFFRSLQVARNLKQGEYQKIPLQSFFCARSITISRSLGDHGFVEGGISKENFESDMSSAEGGYVTDVLIGALIHAITHQQTGAAIHLWKEVIQTDGRLLSLLPFLKKIEETFALSHDESYQKMTDNTEGWAAQTISAIRVAIDQETSPPEMFNAHGFILNLVRKSTLERAVADAASKLVSDNWLRILQYPVTLKSPRTTVPPLKSACESTKTGVHKIADILIAASDAISMRVPSEFIEELKVVRG